MIVHPHTKFQGKILKFRGKSDTISNFCNHFSTPLYSAVFSVCSLTENTKCNSVSKKTTQKTFSPSEEKFSDY